MKPSHRHSLTLTVTLLAACGLSCVRPHPIQMTEAERQRVEKAVNEFHARMNAGEYAQIWEGRFPGLLEDEENLSKYLDWIQQKYGPAARIKLVKGEVRPHIQEPQKRVADCWFEIQTGRGRYKENIIWHFIGDEDKLALHTLIQYDEQNRPYMNLTLRTGLGPNDYQTTKIVLGGPEPESR